MSKLTTAVSILVIQLVFIIAGIAFNQAWLSGFLCVFAWTPAAIFLGFALAGLNFSISVKPKDARPLAVRPTESANQIKQRVSTLEQK